jgi:hypothetical protein
MTSRAIKVGMSVALAVTVGGIAARSARGESGIANVALPPVTVLCPTIGHTSAPDANGWTTQFSGATNPGTVAAQVNAAAGTLECTYTAVPTAGTSFTTADVRRAAPSSGTCVGSGYTRPLGFRCEAVDHTYSNILCPSPPVLTDSLDDPAWTTKHAGVTMTADLINGSLHCREVTQPAIGVLAKPVTLATATRPLGKQTCQVASNGTSFSCTGTQ